MKLLTKKIIHNVKNKEKLAWQFWATIKVSFNVVDSVQVTNRAQSTSK